MSATPLQEIQKRIKEADGPIDKLVELHLNNIPINQFTIQIKQAIEACSNLEVLYLSDCGLNNVNNFPNLDLTAVQLAENNLTDSDLPILASSYPSLGQLIMNDNKVENLQSVKCLSGLAHLMEVDFSNNPIAEKEDYRKFLFNTYLLMQPAYRLPKLDILDQADREGNEQVEEASFVDDSGDDEFDNQLDDQEDGDFDDEDEDEDEFDEDDDDEEEEDEAPRKRTK